MSVQKSILSSLYLVRQALFAGVFLILMLAFFDKFSSHPIFNAVGLSSVAASIFLIFSAPHTLAGQNKSIIGGYLIGIAIGVGCHYLQHNIASPLPANLTQYYPLLCGGLTVVLALLLMTVLQMPHPPAAGLALGIVIDTWEPQGLALIACIITILTILKHILGFKPLIKG